MKIRLKYFLTVLLSLLTACSETGVNHGNKSSNSKSVPGKRITFSTNATICIPDSFSLRKITYWGDDNPTLRKSFVSTHHQKQLSITKFPLGNEGFNLKSYLNIYPEKLKNLSGTGFHLFQTDSEKIKGQMYGIFLYEEKASIDSAQCCNSLSTICQFTTTTKDTLFNFSFIDIDCKDHNKCFLENKKMMQSVVWK